MMQKAKTSNTPAARAPVLEWIVAGLGFALVLVALGLILMQGLSGESSPPDLSVERGEARASPNGWVVEVTVRNHGDETAAGVQVRGESGTETAEAELDYVPAHGEAKASLHFEQAPTADPTVSVAGWREP